MNRRLFQAILLTTVCLSDIVVVHGAEAEADAQRTAIAVEALSRIEGDIDTNPALKNAVTRLLGKTRGTPAFVQIVKKFGIKDQNEGLLEVALINTSEESGVEAIRLLLANNGADLLKKSLGSADPATALKTAEVLGNTTDQQAAALLLPVVTDTKRDVALRKQAVRGLARTAEGAGDLLKLVKAEKLPDDLKFLTGSELNAARWPEIKSEAARLLPPPAGPNAEAFPPLAALLQLKGDAANGLKVLQRETSACLNCHRIGDAGKDIGPALTEIGTKLGKDALMEAVLDPNAGISFGFETHSIELKSGDEAYGLIVSETADELSVKELTGVVKKIKKGDIANRKQLKTSVMPAGLQATMTPQEFADLTEYLSTLKKAGN
ncbi:MAG: c-type cytochrome [Opitutaceae bacterium]|nr:c-type cytochrome [Verrucomicrobiales bacterium]